MACALRIFRCRSAHTLLSANIQFSTDETNSEPTTLTLHAHRSGNAAVFTTNVNDLTHRPLTLNSVVWTPPPWNSVGERAAAQRTPDLSALVAEVVARPSWAGGNPLVFSSAAPANASPSRSTSPEASRHAHPDLSRPADRWQLRRIPRRAGVSNTNGPTVAPDADFDGDGWNNLLEHALGMNPKQPDLPSFHFSVQGRSAHLHLHASACNK
jgi:hypothetical protein